MGNLLHDVKYALRMMRKSPGFTAVALLTLGLGIGACTAIFSVVYGVLLSPLPYPEPDRLVTLWEIGPQTGDRHLATSYPTFLDWREQSRSFENLAGATFGTLRLSGVEEPERVPAAWVSREVFDILRVSPVRGRVFTADEDRVGGDGAVLLSHALWQRKFGGDPGMVGRSVTLDGMAYPVIGILPAGLEFPRDETQVILPLQTQAWTPNMKNRGVHIITVYGRLKPGVSLEQAAAEVKAITQRIQTAHPAEDPGHTTTLMLMREAMVRSSRTAILALFAAVVFVLLIACANIANLMLVRAGARQREMAVRVALGGSRWALARLMLAESLLLALLAGGLGVLLAMWGVDLIVATIPGYLPRTAEIQLHPVVLAFTTLVCLGCAAGFGLAPALRAARLDLSQSLKEGGSGGHGRDRSRGRHALVAVEVSLSLVLLAGAGLMLKSLWNVLHEDPGFRTEQLLTLPVSLPAVEYDEPPSWIRFYPELPARLEALPGVQEVSAVNRLPVSGGDSYGTITIKGRPFPPGESPAASFRRVLPNYFRMMGIPLRQGREFDERDTGAGERVVIINETMARQFWPAGDAVGQRVKIGPPENEPWLTIVGVAGDVRNVGLDSDPALATYEPHAQRPWSSMHLVVRAQGDPLSLVTALRNELRAAERQLFIGQAVTMEQRIFSSLAPRRIGLYVLGLFAALALVLAGVGIYGVMAYAVRERTREIGLRMALGAQAGDVRTMILRQGMALAAGGAALGLAASVAAAHWVSGLLYGVKPTDPLTLAGVTAVLLATAWLACYVPARRATRVDPIEALRHE